jgi:hypothetical protein
LFLKKNLSLDKEEYELENWKANFLKGHFLYPTLKSLFGEDIILPTVGIDNEVDREPANFHCPSIPRFLRNVHHHYGQALREAKMQVSIFQFRQFGKQTTCTY